MSIKEREKRLTLHEHDDNDNDDDDDLCVVFGRIISNLLRNTQRAAVAPPPTAPSPKKLKYKQL